MLRIALDRFSQLAYSACRSSYGFEVFLGTDLTPTLLRQNYFDRNTIFLCSLLTAEDFCREESNTPDRLPS